MCKSQPASRLFQPTNYYGYFKGLKHILTSPSSAMTASPDQITATRPSNAQTHGIRQVTPEVLCYTACLVCFYKSCISFTSQVIIDPFCSVKSRCLVKRWYKRAVSI